MAKLRHLWAFLSDWQAERPQYAPSMREIRDDLGLSSTSVAISRVKKLEAYGYITRVRGVHGARTIRVLIPLITVSGNRGRAT